MAGESIEEDGPPDDIGHFALGSLGDALDMFTMRGWDLADAEVVFQDQIFDQKPDTVPAGESLVWALAKATRRYGSALRYPGEDDVYEKPKLDKLGL